jgi:hypothetical protein
MLGGTVGIRSIAVGAVAGVLASAACAAPPQGESTAIVEPEPLPSDEPATLEPIDDARPTVVTPDEARAAPAPEPVATSEPAAAVTTGIAACDEYLALHRRCEEHLRPQIMAGERRSHRAEAASLQHLASTPEAASMPAACRSMLDQLRVDCPVEHRRPPEPTP